MQATVYGSAAGCDTKAAEQVALLSRQEADGGFILRRSAGLGLVGVGCGVWL